MARVITGTRPLENGLVLDLKFNEGVGTVLHDSSGERNHGVFGPEAAAPTWVEGQGGGRALSFDGSDYVNCGDGASLRVVGDITVAIWSKIPIRGAPGVLIAKYSGSGPDTGWEIWHIANGQVVFGGRDGSGVFVFSGYGPEIDDDIWHFIVGQREGSVWRVIMDMVTPTQNDVGTSGDISAPGIDLYLGVYGAAYVVGTQAEARVWNRALSIEERALLYAQRRRM